MNDKEEETITVFEPPNTEFHFHFNEISTIKFHIQTTNDAYVIIYNNSTTTLDTESKAGEPGCSKAWKQLYADIFYYTNTPF